MEAAVEKRWTVTYTILDCQLHAMREKQLLFFACYGLFGEATCSVSIWKGGLNELTARVHYLHRVLD